MLCANAYQNSQKQKNNKALVKAKAHL